MINLKFLNNFHGIYCIQESGTNAGYNKLKPGAAVRPTYVLNFEVPTFSLLYPAVEYRKLNLLGPYPLHLTYTILYFFYEHYFSFIYIHAHENYLYKHPEHLLSKLKCHGILEKFVYNFLCSIYGIFCTINRFHPVSGTKEKSVIFH